MYKYKLVTVEELGGKFFKSLSRSDGAFIPFDIDNTDCANFLINWKDGAEVIGTNGLPLLYSDEAVAALGLTPLE